MVENQLKVIKISRFSRFSRLENQLKVIKISRFSRFSRQTGEGIKKVRGKKCGYCLEVRGKKCIFAAKSNLQWNVMPKR